MQFATQTNIVHVTQEVSSVVQTQSWEGAVQQQTATCIAIQTWAAIRI